MEVVNLSGNQPFGVCLPLDVVNVLTTLVRDTGHGQASYEAVAREMAAMRALGVLSRPD